MRTNLIPRRLSRSLRTYASTTGVVVAATASVAGALCGGGLAHAATTAPPQPVGVTGADCDECDEPQRGGGRHIGLLVVDNSSADSWLEVDRTLNTLIGSKGTAGSDHDGGGGAIDMRIGDHSGSGSGTGSAESGEDGD
ncbi:hypothetical protein [Streptomyces sp. 150FB]|uniref:hypothetical protein n=1 Tax=Streptomyces sp. 150FB TaxID=1576605 RepID=UPI000695A737|nr:hypothetical protein [Streptomyces sp. 150FB]